MQLNDETIRTLLGDLVQQDYPLTVTADAADALCECIRRIMRVVPDDERAFVRADYNLATSALCHPESELPRTNDRSPHSAQR